MIDPNTGQSKIDIGQLGQALMDSGYAQNSGGMGVLSQLLNTFVGAKMAQGKQPYSGAGAAPNLTNNLPDVFGSVTGL